MRGRYTKRNEDVTNAADPVLEIDAIVASAKAAQRAFETDGSQARYDRAAAAVAWALAAPFPVLWSCCCRSMSRGATGRDQLPVM